MPPYPDTEFPVQESDYKETFNITQPITLSWTATNHLKLEFSVYQISGGLLETLDIDEGLSNPPFRPKY